jgi:signal transduction histidine kinase
MRRLFWGIVALTVLMGVATLLAQLRQWGWAWLVLDGVVGICVLGLVMLLQRLRHQRVEIDRLERIVETRSDRVTALGHEIRTPLAMIKGASDLLLEGKPGPLTEHQLNFVQTVSQNCEQMILLAEDLLVQARIEAGLFKLRLERLDLKDLMYRIVKDARTIAEQRGQMIRIDAPQVMGPVYVDPRLIRQAMMNLLNNASRHTTHGGHIYVSLSENDDRVVVSVIDDGAGMSVEEKKKLFHRFSSGRPLGDGTGMGLVITRQIIELHGGVIMVDTTLGRGTMILFSIPRLKVDDER